MRLAVIVAAVALLWFIAPEVLRASTSSVGAAVRVAALGCALAAWAWVARRIAPNRIARTALVIVPIIGVGLWAIGPYVRDDVVDEAFPVAAGEAATAAPSPAAPRATPSTAPTEAAPLPSATDVAPERAPAPSAESAAPTTTPPPPPPPAEPIALLTGSFQGLTGHRGEGTATIFELADGSRVLRLEDFDVSNGPKLQVHLVPGADQREPGEGTLLADLTGNVGNQNYDVPGDIDLTGPYTVLIWCVPFTVEVANATIS